MTASVTTPGPVEAEARRRPQKASLPALLARRLAWGALTVWVVSVIVFTATQLLGGNAATAILGNTATPEQLSDLEARLHLDRSPVLQYLAWVKGVLTGDPGTSLASGQPVWDVIGPRLVNSACIGLAAALLGTFVGVGLGVVAAWRRDGTLDYTSSVASLVLTALPEFVVGLMFILLLATGVFHLVPPVSVLPPGTYAWQEPASCVLPVLTLAVVIAPYILRMTRAAMVEALESEYVEMARLKGLSNSRILLAHALPNAIPPIIQVIGLALLYLAGGVVVVETVFAFPGIGQGLVMAVDARDIPVVQLIVLILATFYVLTNIATDVVALVATPRRRWPR